MLKEYLREANVSVYRLAKDISEPYSTINDISNGKVNINDCKIGVIKKIAEYFSLSLEQVCGICDTTTSIFSSEFDIVGTLYVKSKQYFLRFTYNAKEYDIRLCKVNEHSTLFITEIAKYEMEKHIIQDMMDEFVRSM